MSNDQASSSSANQTGRYKRRARNYLLDPRFQLKYAGFLVLVTLIVSTLLGIQIWTTSHEVIIQSQHAVEQGKKTISRGRKMLEESRKVSKVVEMNIARDPDYADDPELAKLFKADAEKRAKQLQEEQQRLEEDARNLENQAKYLRDHQRKTLYVLFIGIGLLVLIIGLAGIVFTHKIAGPVYKMQGLLRQVGAGKLRVDTGLRKGDELVRFFETFVQMVDSLRERQQKDLEQVSQALQSLESGDTKKASEILSSLQQTLRSRVDPS